jgi:hypothetical protein
MQFKILDNDKEIAINSDTVPYCEVGHGVVSEVLVFSGSLYCGFCYDTKDRFSSVDFDAEG